MRTASIRSVTQLFPTLCDPMDCSMPGFPVHHQLPDLTQTHVHWVRDAIQPSHPLLSPSPPTNHPLALCSHISQAFLQYHQCPSEYVAPSGEITLTYLWPANLDPSPPQSHSCRGQGWLSDHVWYSTHILPEPWDLPSQPLMLAGWYSLHSATHTHKTRADLSS